MPTDLPDPRCTPRFAGVATFCRYPRLEDVAPAQRPVDFAIYGVPHDGGVTYRPGARFAPRAIREASQYVKRFHLFHGVDVCARLSLADAGDAPVAPFDERACLEGVAAWAAALPDPGRMRLLAVGGDHSIAYANLAATWARMGQPAGGLAVLHFDAHLDTVDTVWDEAWSHASPFRRAIEAGLIDPRAMLSVGIRGPLNTATEFDYGKERGLRVVTAEGAGAGGGAAAGVAAVREFVRELAGRPCYLTFDIDVTDPAYAPGTGTPCPGGFSSAEAFALVRAAAGLRLAGADLVEVLPDRDPAGVTSLLAGHLLLEILALAAL